MCLTLILNIIASQENWNKKLRDWRQNESNTFETENIPILKQTWNEDFQIKFCLILNSDNILFSVRLTLKNFPTSRWCHIFWLKAKNICIYLMKILVSLESNQWCRQEGKKDGMN